MICIEIHFLPRTHPNVRRQWRVLCPLPKVHVGGGGGMEEEGNNGAKGRGLEAGERVSRTAILTSGSRTAVAEGSSTTAAGSCCALAARTACHRANVAGARSTVRGEQRGRGSGRYTLLTTYRYSRLWQSLKGCQARSIGQRRNHHSCFEAFHVRWFCPAIALQFVP